LSEITSLYKFTPFYVTVVTYRTSDICTTGKKN